MHLFIFLAIHLQGRLTIYLYEHLSNILFFYNDLELDVFF